MTDDLDKNESDSAESEDKKEDPIDDLRQFAMDQSNTNDDEITLKFNVSEMSGEEEDKDQGESSPETNPANEQSIEDKPDRGFHAGTDDTQAMAADIKDAFGISDSPNLEDTSVMAGVSSSAEDDPDVTQTIPLSSEAETVVEKIQDTKPKNVPTPMPDEAETKPPTDTSKPKVPAPRSLGESSTKPPPAIDSEGMPLPRSATRPNIVTGPSRTSQTRTQPITDRKPQNPLKRKDTSKPPRKKRRRGGGCFIRIAIILSFVLLILSIGAGSYMLLQYYAIAATLPDVEELQNRVSDFETTNILDRNGKLLYEILDPNAGRRTFVSLDEISPFLIAATIATEDKDYYSHPGFDFWAIVRAFWQNISSGETVSGASTITQQLARTLLLDPDEAFQRTYTRKVKEALLAIEITRKYSKEEILELYLNEIYFGNLAYGIEAAAQTYFGISADKLTLAQGSFLAGLPQAPSVYDVYTNSEVTFSRQQDVLRLMLEASEIQNCILVNPTQPKICIDFDQASLAAFELTNYQFNNPDVQITFPHWVNFIRVLLEDMYDPQTIYRSGFTVETTLDPGLQIVAQASVQKHVFNLQTKNVQSGALVAIDPATGEILVMVGSADYDNAEIDGQINMAVVPRQPGSSIKPFTYVTAFEKGWTPATLIWDVESEFPPSGLETDTREPYIPINYDEKFHGPVTVRVALSNSFNVPAVKTLLFTGVYDDLTTIAPNDGMLEMAHRLGITTLQEDYYGLSLTLGGGEVTLLDMVSAYSVFANSGFKVPPVAITKITNSSGEVVFEYIPPDRQEVIRPEHAFLISSILSDNNARTPSFGPNSVLNLPFQAAAKTGTTNDFRDNWTMGYTPDITVGVWVGNPDYTQMQDTTGLSGAAPIWAEFIQIAIAELTGNRPTPFNQPAGITQTEICKISGTEPSLWCKSKITEFFAFDQPPLDESYDMYRKVLVDTWTGLLASSDCNEFIKEKNAFRMDDDWARIWIDTQQGEDWLDDAGFGDAQIFMPDRECDSNDPQPKLSFDNLVDGQTISDVPLLITAQGSGDGVRYIELSYALASSPRNFQTLIRLETEIPQPIEIYSWDLEGLPEGEIILKLYLQGSGRAFAEKIIRLNIQLPTPTPTPTSTELPTETPTTTGTPTSTATPILTPTPTNTVPIPTDTETPTPIP